jgi:hypothetical protein
MGFFKNFFRSGGNPIVHHADKADRKEKDALAARVYELENNPLGLGGSMGAGRAGGLGMPQINQPPIQYPQLTQLPYFQPNPQGYGMGQGGMPFLRNQAMMNTLSPLMQQNYGLPMISPYAPGTPNGPSQAPPQGQYPGAGQYPIFGGNPGPQMPGLGRWGIQPIMGSAR